MSADLRKESINNENMSGADMSNEVKSKYLEAAAAISPAIRMLSSKAYGFSYIVYTDITVNYTVAWAQMAFRTTGISGSATVFNGKIENMYQFISQEINTKPNARAFHIEGIGTFINGISKSDADYTKECILKGKGYEIDSIRCCTPIGRLMSKIAIITGSAQGFGEGIAEEMAAQGCNVVIADLNKQAALRVRDRLNDLYGGGTAIAVEVDVTSENSVRELVRNTIMEFGGLDILISNAGVLRAGGVEDMTLEDFELVTKVNYDAYFLCVKYATRPMKIQSRFDSDSWSDIIQINSKSGLEGSKRNFAYSGSKFGAIGLTQSFAMELVTDNIKVNAVCPGNFYDGPLWSDPVNGLFVQYLKAGKVPGAKNTDDVKRFYMSKTPIGRGCTPSDVFLAILYCIEQKYETGQAIPVTGGQKMLS